MFPPVNLVRYRIQQTAGQRPDCNSLGRLIRLVPDDSTHRPPQNSLWTNFNTHTVTLMMPGMMI